MKEIFKWQLLESEDISPSKWFPLFRHKVVIGSGETIDDFFVSRLGNVAMVIPVLPTGEIVLVRQYKHGIGEITIEFPAGRIESDQTPEMAAHAELRQETGLKAGSLEPIGEFFPAPTKDSTRVFGFVATECVFSEKQDFDQTEDIDVIRADSRQLDQWIREGKVASSDTIALWSKYKMTRKP
ncbi:NUDIX hydrolase [Propionivibrio soli]|uniref:NUDIX hydrolase n=1 Tax=Propionivibrio soli TaxID=2976531 RepID=UPI0021E853D5|nr:NUDIX hydrolase [Propionivibrio soli]